MAWLQYIFMFKYIQIRISYDILLYNYSTWSHATHITKGAHGPGWKIILSGYHFQWLLTRPFWVDTASQVEIIPLLYHSCELSSFNKWHLCQQISFLEVTVVEEQELQINKFQNQSRYIKIPQELSLNVLALIAP